MGHETNCEKPRNQEARTLDSVDIGCKKTITKRLQVYRYHKLLIQGSLSFASAQRQVLPRREKPHLDGINYKRFA